VIYVIAFLISFAGEPAYLIPKNAAHYQSRADCMKKAQEISDSGQDLKVGCLLIIPAEGLTT